MSYALYVPCAKPVLSHESFGFGPAFTPEERRKACAEPAFGGVDVTWTTALEPALQEELARSVRFPIAAVVVLEGSSDTFADLDETGYGVEDFAADLATMFGGAVFTEELEPLDLDPGDGHAAARVRGVLYASAFEPTRERARAWTQRAADGDVDALEVVAAWARFARPIGPAGQPRNHDAQLAHALLEAADAAPRLSAGFIDLFAELLYMPLIDDRGLQEMLASKCDNEVLFECVAELRAIHEDDIEARRHRA